MSNVLIAKFYTYKQAPNEEEPDLKVILAEVYLDRSEDINELFGVISVMELVEVPSQLDGILCALEALNECEVFITYEVR